MIDCQDAERLASFWSQLLGQPVAARIGPYVWLERRDQVSLGFQTISDPKQGKNRLHLDLGSADPVAQRHRVEALGGRHVKGYEEGGFLVMADPEGNEFCLIPDHPFDVTDQGQTTYLTRTR
jgi:predicted enzyme related to lactoylglutathione lyase